MNSASQSVYQSVFQDVASDVATFQVLSDVLLKPNADALAIPHLLVLNNRNLQSNERSNSQSIDQSLIESINPSDSRLIISPRPCSLCQAESYPSIASIYCTICCEWLCVDHLSIHNRRQEWSDHVIWNIEEINKKPDFDPLVNDPSSIRRHTIRKTVKSPRYQCSEHRQFFDSFCPSCYRYICPTCVLSRQCNHERVTIEQKWKREMQLIDAFQPDTYMSIKQRDMFQLNLSVEEEKTHFYYLDEVLDARSLILKLSSQLTEADDEVKNNEQITISSIQGAVARIASSRSPLPDHALRLRKRLKSCLAGHRDSLQARRKNHIEARANQQALDIRLRKIISFLDFMHIQKCSSDLATLLATYTKLVDKFKRPISKRLVMQPAVLSLGTKLVDVIECIDKFDSCFQAIISHWREVRPLQLSQQEQSHRSNDQTISQSNNRAINQSNNQSTSLNDATNKSTINNRLGFVEPDVDIDLIVESPLSWDTLSVRLNILFGDHVYVQAICEDLSTLCFDPWFALVYLEDSCYTSVFRFASIHLLSHNMNYFCSLMSSLTMICTRSPDRFTGPNEYIKRILKHISGIDQSSPYWFWKFSLELALGKADNRLFPRSKYTNCYVAHFSSAVAVQNVRNLKNVPHLRVLQLDFTDDQTCQLLASNIKHVSEVRSLQISGPHNISEATTTGLLSSLSAHLPNLHDLTIFGDCQSDAVAAGLPSLLSLMALRMTRLNEEGSRKIAQVLPSCHSLTDLSLESCRPRASGFSALSITLPLLGSMRRLYLNHCRIEPSDRPMSCKMFDSIGQCTSLRHLLMDHMDLNKDQGKSVIASVRNLVHLQKLSLNYNMHMNPDFEPLVGGCANLQELFIHRVGKFDGSALGRVLNNCQSLSIFDIGFNAISNFHLVFEHPHWCSRLKQVDISRISMENNYSAQIFPVVQHFTSAQHFTISCLRCQGKMPKSYEVLINGLRDLKCLTYLDLSYLYFGPSCSLLLAESLKEMNHLVSLNLGSILLDTASAAHIAEGLWFTPHLTFLYLADNSKLGTKGLARLKSSLIRLPKLRSLYLAKCGFTPQAGRMIGEIIRHTPMLLTLSLGGNRLEEDGIRDIVNNLSHVPFLEELSLEKVELNDRALKLVAVAVHQLKCLTSFDVTENPRVSMRLAKQVLDEFPYEVAFTDYYSEDEEDDDY